MTFWGFIPLGPNLRTTIGTKFPNKLAGIGISGTAFTMVKPCQRNVDLTCLQKIDLPQRLHSTKHTSELVYHVESKSAHALVRKQVSRHFYTFFFSKADWRARRNMRTCVSWASNRTSSHNHVPCTGTCRGALRGCVGNKRPNMLYRFDCCSMDRLDGSLYVHAFPRCWIHRQNVPSETLDCCNEHCYKSHISSSLFP